jgi:hypothetical protein
LSYQWYQGAVPVTNGAMVSGAQTNALNFTPAATNEAGSYKVVVANVGGSVTSSAAALGVAPWPRLGILNAPSGFTVTATGCVASNYYVVQRSSNLLSGWISTYTNYVETNGVIIYSRTNNHDPARFIRIVFP